MSRYYFTCFAVNKLSTELCMQHYTIPYPKENPGMLLVWLYIYNLSLWQHWIHYTLHYFVPLAVFGRRFLFILSVTYVLCPETVYFTLRFEPKCPKADCQEVLESDEGSRVCLFDVNCVCVCV